MENKRFLYVYINIPEEFKNVAYQFAYSVYLRLSYSIMHDFNMMKADFHLNPIIQIEGNQANLYFQIKRKLIERNFLKYVSRVLFDNDRNFMGAVFEDIGHVLNSELHLKHFVNYTSYDDNMFLVTFKNLNKGMLMQDEETDVSYPDETYLEQLNTYYSEKYGDIRHPEDGPPDFDLEYVPDNPLDIFNQYVKEKEYRFD